MEDMAGKISELLNDPGTLQQIMNLTSMLGGDSAETANVLPPPKDPQPPPPKEEEEESTSGDMMQNIMRLAPLLGKSNQEEKSSSEDMMQKMMSLAPLLGNSAQEEESSPLSGNMMQTMIRLAPLLGNLNQEDDTTRLLHSLRPFLSERRREKLDQAGKILQLLKILPVLKEINL